MFTKLHTKMNQIVSIFIRLKINSFYSLSYFSIIKKKIPELQGSPLDAKSFRPPLISVLLLSFFIHVYYVVYSFYFSIITIQVFLYTLFVFLQIKKRSLIHRDPHYDESSIFFSITHLLQRSGLYVFSISTEAVIQIFFIGNNFFIIVHATPSLKKDVTSFYFSIFINQVFLYTKKDP